MNRNNQARGVIVVAAVMLAMLALAASAFASTKNSIQPGRLVFGAVQSGQHPNKLVTLHNGTGQTETIKTIGISGAGGYAFTLAANTKLLEGQSLPRCTVGMVLAPGARCAMDVRVHTIRPNWWRSVLRVVYADGHFNSAQLEAHVVASS